MKRKTILFPFDDADVISEKIVRLTKIVGKDNIVKDGLKLNPPEVIIRCDKKRWKEVKFKLELYKVYY